MKSNTLDIETVVEMADMQLDGDAAKVQMFRGIANECASQTDADRCEAAAKICGCVQKGVQAKGLTFSM